MLTKYSKIIYTAELVCLALATIGFLLIEFNGKGTLLIIIGLGCLATIFMLSTYIPTKTTEDKGETKGFAKLFAYTVLPKVLYISMAVCSVGILYNVLDWEGAVAMLQIGVNTLFLALVFLIISSLNKEISLKHFTAVLIRAIPLILIGAYMFYV